MKWLFNYTINIDQHLKIQTIDFGNAIQEELKDDNSDTHQALAYRSIDLIDGKNI